MVHGGHVDVVSLCCGEVENIGHIIPALFYAVLPGYGDLSGKKNKEIGKKVSK